MDAAALLTWCTGAFEPLLGDAAEDMAAYVVSIEDDEDLCEYITELGMDVAVAQELMRRRAPAPAPGPTSKKNLISRPRGAQRAAAPQPAPAPAAPAPAPAMEAGYYRKKDEEEEVFFIKPKQKQKPQANALQAAAAAGVDYGAAENAPTRADPRNDAGTFASARSGGIKRRGQGQGAKDKEKDKVKTTNLNSADPSTLLRKGRHMCDCQGLRHRLMGNCTACGLIVCEQIGEGPCLFCAGECRAVQLSSELLPRPELL
jgi:hypothetical protein